MMLTCLNFDNQTRHKQLQRAKITNEVAHATRYPLMIIRNESLVEVWYTFSYA